MKAFPRVAAVPLAIAAIAVAALAAPATGTRIVFGSDDLPALRAVLGIEAPVTA